MSVLGLFILTASLLATLWAGKITLVDASLLFFGAAALVDALVILRKFMQAYTVGVTIHGLAQGSFAKGIQDALRTAPRTKGQQDKEVDPK
jgi:LPS O-antigen subunit length determinant protein (WzzB/FepE family)